jgi:hypothetical protein
MDEDILKTLQSIEKLLKSSSAFVGDKKLPTSAARAQQTSSQRAGRDANKAFKATATNLKDTNDAITGLNRNLVSLNSEVGKTTVGFGSLNTQMGKFMASLTPLDKPETAASQTATTNDGLMGLLASQHQTMMKGILHQSSMTLAVISAIGVSNKWLGVIAATVGGATANAAMPNLNQQAAQMMGQVGQGIQRGAAPAGATLAKPQAQFAGWLQRMVTDFGQSVTIMGTLPVIFGNLSKVVVKLTTDFFMLSQQGLGSTNNLITLSKQALLSGMSLKDYTEIINKNITFASRAGSLENFDKITSAANSQLAEMGIFGQQSKQLQASLAQTATMMGVNQKDLTGTIAGQISVFDKLRKSTNMTAAEFAGLMDTLSKHDQVQSELVGTSGQERIARRQALTQTAMIGQKMGLTAEASAKLTEALLAQRGQSVKSRFEQAGRVRQLSQLTGMGAEGEEAAQLVMKGRNRTAEDDARLQEIAAKLETASQGAYEQGSLGVQSAIDNFQETLGQTSFGQIMKASRPGVLAEDSGKVNQAAFGQHVGAFGQFVGNLTSFFHGISESIVPGIVGALGGAMLLFFRGPILKAMQLGLSRFVPGAAVGASAAAGSAGVAAAGASIGQTIGALGKTMMQAPSTLMNGVRGIAQTFRGASSLVGPAIATLSMGLDGAAVVLRGLANFTKAFGVASMLIDPIIELFTGEISKAMDPNGGVWARMVGVLTSGLTAIPNLIVNVLELVFGEKFMKPIRSVFDVIRTGVAGAINGFVLALLGAVSWITDLLPEDSKLRTMVTAARDSARASMEANTDTIRELGGISGTLNETGQKTLGEISASQEKKRLADEAAKAATSATTKAVAAQSKFNNVQYGMELSRQGLVNDAKTILGSPQVQTPVAVKPAAVNTPDETAKPSAAKVASEQAVAALGGPEVMVALNAILAVMRENLVQEQRQAEATELLVKGNRPMASFVPAEIMADRVLKGNYA